MKIHVGINQKKNPLKAIENTGTFGQKRNLGQRDRNRKTKKAKQSCFSRLSSTKKRVPKILWL